MRAISARLAALAYKAVEAQARAEELPPTGETPYQRFRAILGAEQLALIDDNAPLVSADPGRRAGKTTAFIGKSLQTFELPDSDRAGVVYFAPSDAQGVDIVWEDIREHNRTYDLGLRERWSDRWWTRGTRKIEVIGFNARKDVQRARGRKWRLVWIDEAQLAPDWFAKIALDAILPTTLDYRGQVYATGTPGEVADGFFFDACHEASWSHEHHWTVNQNPFYVRAGRDGLAEARAMYNLALDSTTYRREWLGLWIVDPDALVYYIPDAAIRPAPAGMVWYAHVIGLDLGWKDHDAIAAVGVEQLRQWSQLRHMETKGQQTNHQLFKRLMDIAPHFPGPNKGAPTVVYDPAGHATKKTIETFRSDAPQIHWVQADKPEKVQFIDWLSNDLREGKHFVEPGNSMIREALRVRWKRPGKVAEDASHSDQGDAWLYSQRHARNMLREVPREKPKKELDPLEQHMQRVAEDGQRGYFRKRKQAIG